MLIHFLLYFGKARCMRMPPPGAAESGVELATAAALGPAASGAAEKDAEAGEGALPAPDATDGSSDGGLTKAAAIDGAAVAPAKGEAATYVPHPDAPAGLFYVSAADCLLSVRFCGGFLLGMVSKKVNARSINKLLQITHPPYVQPYRKQRCHTLLLLSHDLLPIL